MAASSMINYSVDFLSEEHRVASQKAGSAGKVFDDLSKKCGNEACAILEFDRITRDAMMSGKLPKVTWEKIVEHIDHAVKVAGVEHVGLGSDFDGQHRCPWAWKTRRSCRRSRRPCSTGATTSGTSRRFWAATSCV